MKVQVPSKCFTQTLSIAIATVVGISICEMSVARPRGGAGSFQQRVQEIKATPQFQRRQEIRQNSQFQQRVQEIKATPQFQQRVQEIRQNIQQHPEAQQNLRDVQQSRQQFKVGRRETGKII